jgi:phenolic acid decarboxylase
MKIIIHPYEPFVEMETTIDYKIHPNLTDSIWVSGQFCKIEEIVHDIDDETIIIRLISDDPIHVVLNEYEVVKRLIYDIKEFEDCGWYLNDYDFLDKAVLLRNKNE